MNQKQIQFLLGTLMVLLAAVSVRGALYTETFSRGRPVETIPDGMPRDAFGNDFTVSLGATVTVNPTLSPGAGPLAGTPQLNLGTAVLSDLQVNMNLGTAVLSDLQINQAENYDVLTEAFDVVKWAWTVEAAGANKTYDDTTTAKVTWLDNKVSGDAVKDSYTSAGFSGKTSGTDAGNYNLQSITTTASTSANNTRLAVIWPGSRTYDGTKAAAHQPMFPSANTAAGSRTYDGTKAATAPILKSGNNLDRAKLTLSGSGPLADKNAGSQPISAGPLTPHKSVLTSGATWNFDTGTPTATPYAANTLNAAVFSAGSVSGEKASSQGSKMTAGTGDPGVALQFNAGNGSGTKSVNDGNFVLSLTVAAGISLNSITINYNYLATDNPGTSTAINTWALSVGGSQIANITENGQWGSASVTFSGLNLAGGSSFTLTDTLTGYLAGANNIAEFDNIILGANVVPEPVNVALGIFGVLLGGLGLARYHAAKRRSVLQPQA